MAEVFVRQAAFFGTKQKSHSPAEKLRADEPGALFQPHERMLELAPAGCRRAYHEHAVGNGFSHAWKLSRIQKDLRRADGRPRLAKRSFERFHDAQIGEAEVAYGPRGRADIERIARVDQNDGEMAGLAIFFQVAIPLSVISNTVDPGHPGRAPRSILKKQDGLGSLALTDLGIDSNGRKIAILRPGFLARYLLGMQKQRLLPSGSVTANSRSPHV